MAMSKTPRDYIASVKNWKVRNMIQGYLQACHAYHEMRRTRMKNRRAPSFEVLRAISATLSQVKEDHHLIFRRREEANTKGSRHKLVPGYADTAFSDHVGLLFHKVMVACELRYILTHYAHQPESWEAHFQTLLANLQQLDTIFEEGINLVLEFVRSHSDNVLVIDFVLEHQKQIAACARLDTRHVLRKLLTKVDLPGAYFMAAQYYFESGWFDRAVKAARKCLQADARHAAGQALLQQARARLQAGHGGAADPVTGTVAAETTIAT
ncbi:MAG: hypothetical protein ONB48_12855 [candidate division KSB1 bacterium]|nr:hypothetical protein [candidate division KSB1 bacterium]MDZ7275015.1 hypothetical protein [candidate division KSB1 bacterium]MDZ7286536.1 hypothetical protein [candidate division KSB1 bacterium]MDZ7299300.1 hypothetical protein [candidate division KSB1 bacterium]MDZ7307360.1 hypothetical protein [candidate division KSB1 bacterium]